MQKLSKSLAIVLITLAGASAPVSAAGFGCEGSAGGVIFQDTIYGTGVGLVLSGLYIWSRNDDKDFNQERALANGTLTGALLGTALGVTEISLRTCGERQRAEQAKPEAESKHHFSFALAPAPDDRRAAPTVAWRRSF